MILGIGSDLIDVKRINRLIEQFDKRFLDRIYTPAEQLYCNSQKKQAHAYAKRFAAKEACAKALGLGIQEGISWTDVEVKNTPHGKPFLCLSGGAQQHLDRLVFEKGVSSAKAKIDLSLSDEGFLAQAFVILSLTKE